MLMTNMVRSLRLETVYNLYTLLLIAVTRNRALGSINLKKNLLRALFRPCMRLYFWPADIIFLLRGFRATGQGTSTNSHWWRRSPPNQRTTRLSFRPQSHRWDIFWKKKTFTKMGTCSSGYLHQDLFLSFRRFANVKRHLRIVNEDIFEVST